MTLIERSNKTWCILPVDLASFTKTGRQQIYKQTFVRLNRYLLNPFQANHARMNPKKHTESKYVFPIFIPFFNVVLFSKRNINQNGKRPSTVKYIQIYDTHGGVLSVREWINFLCKEPISNDMEKYLNLNSTGGSSYTSQLSTLLRKTNLKYSNLRRTT